MENVIENKDLRKVIWSYLRKKPEPLKQFATFYEKIPKFPKLGDIIEIFENNTYNYYSYDINKNLVKQLEYEINRYYPNIMIVIPYKITQHISNAVEYYENFNGYIANIVIYLRWDDKFIVSNIGNLPMFWKYSLIVDYEILEVEYSDINKIHKFDINIVTKKDIMDFYNECK